MKYKMVFYIDYIMRKRPMCIVFFTGNMFKAKIVGGENKGFELMAMIEKGVVTAPGSISVTGDINTLTELVKRMVQSECDRFGIDPSCKSRAMKKVDEWRRRLGKK